MRTTILASTLVTVLATALTACGGSSASSSSAVSSDAPTKAVFLGEAKVLCKRGVKVRNIALNKAVRESKATAAPTEASLKVLLITHVVPVYEKTVEELSRLTPPQGGEEQFEKIIAALEAAAAELRKNPLANTSLEKAAKLATAYGIPECGE